MGVFFRKPRRMPSLARRDTHPVIFRLLLKIAMCFTERKMCAVKSCFLKIFGILAPSCFFTILSRNKKKRPPEHLSPHLNEAPPPDPEITGQSSVIQPPNIPQWLHSLSERVGWLKTPLTPCDSKSYLYKYLPTEISPVR